MKTIFCFRWIQSYDSNPGRWSNASYCAPHSVSSGLRLKTVHTQKSYWDYFTQTFQQINHETVTGLGMRCSDNGALGITAENSATNGNWVLCKKGKSVCGFRTKWKDENEVAGVELRCCTNSNTLTRRRKYTYIHSHYKKALKLTCYDNAGFSSCFIFYN